MRFTVCILTFLFLFVSSVVTAEETFDGSKPLLCASIEAIDCVSGPGCVKNLPEVIGAPQFMKIDFTKKEILGPRRTTSIQLMDKNETQILLHGVELNMGWVFALDRATGKFSATLADRGGVFVIFGACTTL